MQTGQRFFDARPWYYRFLFYLVAFGTLTYLIQRDGLAWAAITGLFFATLMTLVDRWRLGRQRSGAPQ